MSNREDSLGRVIDSWLAQLDERLVGDRLQTLEQRVAEIHARQDALQAELDVLAVEISKAREVLDLKQRLRSVESPRVDGVAGNGSPNLGRVRGRNAVRFIISKAGPDREWRADDIKTEMVQRGWMTDDESLHPIQVSLSRMAREGELERARYGVYKLASRGEQAETTTNVHREDGEGSQGRGDLRQVPEGLPLAQEGAPDEAHRAGS